MVCLLSSFFLYTKKDLSLLLPYTHHGFQWHWFPPPPTPTAWWMTIHSWLSSNISFSERVAPAVTVMAMMGGSLKSTGATLVPWIVIYYRHGYLAFHLFLFSLLGFFELDPFPRLYHPSSSAKSTHFFLPWRLSCTPPKTSFTTWPSSSAPWWTLLCYFAPRTGILFCLLIGDTCSLQFPWLTRSPMDRFLPKWLPADWTHWFFLASHTTLSGIASWWKLCNLKGLFHMQLLWKGKVARNCPFLRLL